MACPLLSLLSSPLADVLTWDGRTSVAGKLGLAKESRFLALAAVRELLVGRESSVFRNANWKDRLSVDVSVSGHIECSLTLSVDPMRHALSQGVKPDTLFKEAGASRQSLDISFTDEIHFGLVLAALRGLLPAHVTQVPDDSVLVSQRSSRPSITTASNAPTAATSCGPPVGVDDPFGIDPFQPEAEPESSLVSATVNTPKKQPSDQLLRQDSDPFGLGDLSGASHLPTDKTTTPSGPHGLDPLGLDMLSEKAEPVDPYDLASLLGPLAPTDNSSLLGPRRQNSTDDPDLPATKRNSSWSNLFGM